MANTPPLDMARRHARRLAALDGASERAIVEAMSLWPLGARLVLSSLGIIDYGLSEEAAERGSAPSHDEVLAAARAGQPTDFWVTEHGMKVIADCAEWRRQNEPEGAAEDAPVSGHQKVEEWPDSLASSEDLERAAAERHVFGG